MNRVRRLSRGMHFDWKNCCDWCGKTIDHSDAGVREIGAADGYIHGDCVDPWIKRTNELLDEEEKRMGLP